MENENIKTVIFETHDRFPKKVYDAEGLMLDFNRQNINLVRDSNGNLVRLNKSDSWICTLTEEHLIERAKAHKSFQKAYWIINKIPTSLGESIARSGPGVSTAGSENVQASIKEIKEKALRFGELKGKILKTDGTFLSSATPNQIEEYTKLKIDLNE